jgi:hypothetical protein
MQTKIASQHIDLLRQQLDGPYSHLPRQATVAVLMKHGGFQILIQPGHVLSRLKRQLGPSAAPSAEDTPAANQQLADAAVAIQARAELFFQRLCTGRYGIPSELISYLTFPHEGATYTDPAAAEAENPNLPAVFTFVGQFIDHDLTFNGANLFDDQSGDNSFPDFASPQLDLDSVYGGRGYPTTPPDPALKDIISNKYVFNDDMSFKLVRLGPNAYDLTRWPHPGYHGPDQPSRDGSAFIFDPRNDENQLVLHVHILLMRVHNKLLKQLYAGGALDPHKPADAEQAWAAVKHEVIANWQSVVLNDYLPRVCQPDVLAWVLAQLQLSGHGAMKYKPAADGTLQMPHEFAIAFRFGHSMLRTAYNLNGAGPIQLFNNRDLTRKGDLRGGRPLTRDHVIDWDFFYPQNEFDAPLSLKIDSKVTSVVFDLPESAIPDSIKTTGNLPFRNLTRSREIDIACGEDLANFFGITDPSKLLTRYQVEPNDQAHYLFEADVDIYTATGGKPPAGDPLTGVKDTSFKTPLWYYVLKEGEIFERGERLGPLGSRIVAEVILGGIFYGKDTSFDYNWNSQITGNNIVKLRDLIDFVNETPPTPIHSVDDLPA